MWAFLSPIPTKRKGTVPSFALWLRLSMISWGQFYVMERFCDFLKRDNLLIKLQPWLTFLETNFCPCLYSFFKLSLYISPLLSSVACAGFILAGAENIFRGGRIVPEGREKFLCPPCFYFCPPGRIRFCPWGRTDKRGGRKPLYTKSINTNISHQFLDCTITFVNWQQYNTN